MRIGSFLSTFLQLYGMLLFAYIILSWFVGGSRGLLRDIYVGLGTICEPYLSIFRRFLPPVIIGGGGLDLSPIIGLFVLQIIRNLVAGL